MFWDRDDTVAASGLPMEDIEIQYASDADEEEPCENPQEKKKEDAAKKNASGGGGDLKLAWLGFGKPTFYGSEPLTALIRNLSEFFCDVHSKRREGSQDFINAQRDIVDNPSTILKHFDDALAMRGWTGGRYTVDRFPVPTIQEHQKEQRIAQQIKITGGGPKSGSQAKQPKDSLPPASPDPVPAAGHSTHVVQPQPSGTKSARSRKAKRTTTDGGFDTVNSGGSKRVRSESSSGSKQTQVRTSASAQDNAPVRRSSRLQNNGGLSRTRSGQSVKKTK